MTKLRVSDDSRLKGPGLRGYSGTVIEAGLIAVLAAATLLVVLYALWQMYYGD